MIIASIGLCASAFLSDDQQRHVGHDIEEQQEDFKHAEE
jgi:hypothetical protein